MSGRGKCPGRICPGEYVQRDMWLLLLLAQLQYTLPWSVAHAHQYVTKYTSSATAKTARVTVRSIDNRIYKFLD